MLKFSFHKQKSVYILHFHLQHKCALSFSAVSGLRLPFDKFTVYLDPGQNTSEFRLPGSSYTGYYQEGSYMFSRDPNEYSQKSLYYINVTGGL